MKLLAWLRESLRDKRGDALPRPADWCKTLADLHAEHRDLTGHEIRWAREYEREQLRGRVRFPVDGEVFEATCEVTVPYVMHWKAPYSGGGKTTLPCGERVRVSVPASDPEPIGVYAEPVERRGFEERVVEEADRRNPKYDGISVFLAVADIDRHFRRVE
jgi:hypothetical protein